MYKDDSPCRRRPSKKEPIYCDQLYCDRVYSPDLSFAHLHRDALVEISMVCKGSGIHRVLGQAIPCEEGDIYVVLPNIPHAYFLTEQGSTLEVRRILFDVDSWFDSDVKNPDNTRFCYGVFGDNAQVAYATLNSNSRSDICFLFDSIEREISERQNEWADCVRAYLSLMLVTIGRYVSSAKKNIRSFPPKELEIVTKALRAIEQHFPECSLTLERIARTLYISDPKLSRLFKKITGRSFSEYLRDFRIEQACRLLRETDLTVEEIVIECGLRDVPSFYRNFSIQMNTTPSKYRELSVKKQNINIIGERIMIVLSEISANLQKGKAKIVKEMVQQALDEGAAPIDILNQGLLDGMNVIGEKFKNNEVYVPEVLVAARAMNMGMQILKPHLAESVAKATGKVCIGTVQGDLHDIGKNLVRMMLEGKGLEVVDLGVDVPAEKFVQTAIEEGCQVICCSALLTTTMNVMAEVVKAVDAAGVRDKIKVMVGGAPVNQDFCDSIGADCYTTDAASAADAAVALCKSVM